ncbi:hypothetical protein [Nocardia higoensis]|nr:hypothetical protein [Nocardia higoensis]
MEGAILVARAAKSARPLDEAEENLLLLPAAEQQRVARQPPA